MVRDKSSCRFTETWVSGAVFSRKGDFNLSLPQAHDHDSRTLSCIVAFHQSASLLSPWMCSLPIKHMPSTNFNFWEVTTPRSNYRQKSWRQAPLAQHADAWNGKKGTSLVSGKHLYWLQQSSTWERVVFMFPNGHGENRSNSYSSNIYRTRTRVCPCFWLCEVNLSRMRVDDLGGMAAPHFFFETI